LEGNCFHKNKQDRVQNNVTVLPIGKKNEALQQSPRQS